MSALKQPAPSPPEVLAKALLRASAQLGLNQVELAQALGVHRTAISRYKNKGELDPASKQGELGLLIIRLARALYALTGGDEVWMRHFMRSPNRLSGGVPAEQIATIEGLMNVLRFVDAIRGKT